MKTMVDEHCEKCKSIAERLEVKEQVYEFNVYGFIDGIEFKLKCNNCNETIVKSYAIAYRCDDCPNKKWL